ncbi:hypothetical protein DSUL_90011 [Desulfovibrionales bacterium]
MHSLLIFGREVFIRQSLTGPIALACTLKNLHSSSFIDMLD